VLWERPERGAASSVLEPDLSRCFVCCCGRPISPAFAPSRRSGQECDFFGQMAQYEPRGARILRTVAWGDCGATGGFSCRDAGQLEWPSSGGRLHRLRRWWTRALFSLFLPTDGCVCQVLGADLAAAGQVAPVGVRRRALLLLTGSWPVGMVRTMCSASPCWEAISDPICVLTLLLCRLQTCCRCTDGRGSREHEWDGFDERGGVILGVAGVRRQRLRFGERCPAGARARCGCWWRVGCAASCVPAGSR